MIKGLVFDKDGTLFDFDLSWSKWAVDTLQSFAKNDGAVAASYADAIGFDWENKAFHPDSPAIAGTLDWIVNTLAAASGRDRISTRLYLESATASADMVPAAPLVPLMAELQARDLALGVATNDGEVPARAHLAAHGILGVFDYVVGSDSGHGAKPGPGMITGFLEVTGLARSEVVMVGDSTHDLEAGRAAGCTTLGVLNGPAQASDLAALADAIMPDISHLPAWLDAGAPKGFWGAD